MKRAFFQKFIKRTTAILLLIFVVSAAAGCEYDSVDDYLTELGIKDSAPGSDSAGKGNSSESASGISLFEPLEDLLGEAGVDLDEDSVMETTDRVASDLASSFSSVHSSLDEAETVVENAGDEHAALSSDEVAADSSAQAASSLGEPPADTRFEQSYTGRTGAGTSADDKAAREAIGLTDEGIAARKKEQAGRYAFERLTDSGKTLYVEILTILQNQSEGIVVSTTSIDAIEMVFDYVMLDHPELFYVTALKYTNYKLGNSTTKIAFSGIYSYEPAEVARRQAGINEAVNRCLAGAPSSDDEYFAIKYVYEYLITNTDYSPGAEDNQNICSVFLNRKSVCNGYAKAAQLLLNRLGIECTLVTGTVHNRNSSGERHAWNLVKCNGQYYYLDVTWGDASYQTVSGESADISKIPAVNYDYLNVTTAEITKNHTLPDYIYMPMCSSMADNYYVREGNYFTSPELSLVKDLFDRGYSEGRSYVTIKCSSDTVYQILFDELVTNRKVFGYLQGNQTTVAYTTFEETDTIIFWI